MFEPIHGSAPRMIEQGLGNYANPTSIFKAAAMLLRHISLTAKADLLEKAISYCTEVEPKYVVTGYADGATCREFADYLMETIEKMV